MLSILTTDLQQPDRQTLEAAREHLRMSKAEMCRCLGIAPRVYNGYLRGSTMSPLVLNRLDMLLRDRRAGHFLKRKDESDSLKLEPG